jgi:hypothetical protein
MENRAESGKREPRQERRTGCRIYCAVKLLRNYEMPKCRSAEVPKCRSAEVPKCQNYTMLCPGGKDFSINRIFSPMPTQSESPKKQLPSMDGGRMKCRHACSNITTILFFNNYDTSFAERQYDFYIVFLDNSVVQDRKIHTRNGQKKCPKRQFIPRGRHAGSQIARLATAPRLR